MAEVEIVFPDATPAPGVGLYPFRFGCEVYDRSGDKLAEAKCDVWTNAQNQDGRGGGESYSYGGIVSAPARAELVGQRNRILLVNGLEYRVQSATWHDVLGYVEVDLVIVDPDG